LGTGQNPGCPIFYTLIPFFFEHTNTLLNLNSALDSFILQPCQKQIIAMAIIDGGYKYE